MQEVFTGIGIKIQGHLKIIEYKDLRDYRDRRANRVLLNKRNAVHKENASVMIVNGLTNRDFGNVAYMVFGNGGTSLDSFGNVVFLTPNDSGPNANLYNPVFFQLVDDKLGSLAGNQMGARHIGNSMFTDVDIRCLIGVNQPFGQLPSNQSSGINLNTSSFAFDEIGLKLLDGTLLTHVIFSPVLKTASSILEVIYTLRTFIEQPPAPPPPPINFMMDGVEAITEFSDPTVDIIPPVYLVGVEAPTEFGVLDFNYRVHGVRLNNSPYFINMPNATVLDSPQGTLSLWVKGTDIFNMSHDDGPALLSSGYRQTMEISGRGYIRRNPSDITRANPCQITIPNHGLSTGDTVEFTHVLGGCSELEGLTETITFVDMDNFTIGVDSSAFASAYTGPAQVTFITANKPELNTMRIVFQDNDTNPTKIFYWNSSESIPSDQWVNLLISWDMDQPAGSKILQVFVNDTEWTSTSDPSYRYDPDTAFSIAYTSAPKWVIGEPVFVRNYVQFAQVTREVLYVRSP